MGLPEVYSEGNMPDPDKPGLAVIIASKRKGSSTDDDDESSDKEEKIAGEMAEEILDEIKSEDPKKLGKALMNFVRYVMNERE